MTWLLAEAATEETLEAIRVTLLAIEEQLGLMKGKQDTGIDLGQVILGTVIGGFGAVVTLAGLYKLWSP